MSFRFQRPLGVPGMRLQLWDSGADVADRGAWSTTRARDMDSSANLSGDELSYVIIEQGRRPFKALGLVLLMIVLAALAFVVAAQG